MRFLTKILETEETQAPLLTSSLLQLITYPIVVQRDCTIDMPRKRLFLTRKTSKTPKFLRFSVLF